MPLNSKLLAKEADISRKQSIGKRNFVSLGRYQGVIQGGEEGGKGDMREYYFMH